MSYPVRFDVERPLVYDRAQIGLRLILWCLMAAFGVTLGWLFGLLYLALPAVAAGIISSRGGRRYLDEAGPTMIRFLRWVIAFHAYLGLLTDRPPVAEAELGIELAVEPSGTPTVRSALMRLLTSIPAALVLMLLGVVSAVVWCAGVVLVLATRELPEPLYDFQRGVLRWQARLYAYHASLVEEPAPISLETGATPRAV